MKWAFFDLGEGLKVVWDNISGGLQRVGGLLENHRDRYWNPIDDRGKTSEQGL